MKTKSIILSGLLLIGLGAATTSCEDMFTPENDHVTTDMTPQDTVYQVMGIVGKMQKLVDQTILLGEVRSDLVTISSTADKNLQELASAAKIGTDNVYNNPSAFYDVINSCNIYLAYVDSAQVSNGIRKYEKEVLAVKTYRAWAYLELAKIYNNVPLVLDPILTANAADEAVTSGARADMIKICDTFISDLESEVGKYTFKNNELRPSYGASYNGVSLSKCFIPLRVMLGELYLWRGAFTQSKEDYKKAAGYYQSFLAFTGEERRISSSKVNSWKINDDNPNISFEVGQGTISSYTNLFTSGSDEIISLIPMDVEKYYGTYSNLYALFNSSYSNSYYAPINPSQRLDEISKAQTYCTYIASATEKQAYYAPKLAAHYQDNPRMQGDLRLPFILTNSTLSDMERDDFSKETQLIEKYGDFDILSSNPTENQEKEKRVKHATLFRTNTVYLHMAEALSRAGFPETAFAVLKYGIANDILTTDSIVPASEYARLNEIQVPGAQYNFTRWGLNDETFKSLHRLVFESSSTATEIDPNIQRGIHDFGSGDSYMNKYYALPSDSTDWRNLNAELAEKVPAPTKPSVLASQEEWDAYNELYVQYQADSTVLADEIAANNEAWYQEQLPVRQAAVDSLILEEMALEGVFEGHRYYDLMRYAKYKGTPSFMGDRIAERTGKDSPDAALKSFYSNESNWYLELRAK